MKKLFKSLICAALAATLIGAAACGGASSDTWKGTTFTDYGAVDVNSLGGFVAETANYVYFINGVEYYSSDNTFGKPIKGALVAAKKSDLSQTEVVIPELMVSSDYNAGVYIFGSGADTYAYYGTPNKEKDSSGAVANYEMTFTKTRLDGKVSQKLFTVASHSTEYRVAEKNGVVYIVYYDNDNTALTEYNCTTGVKKVIAKTDDKVGETNGEYLSLGSYNFLDNVNAAQVVYTMTAYAEPYYEDKADSRATEKYNYMYLYSAGEDPVLIADGKVAGDEFDGNTYAVKSVIGEYLFYTATPVVGSEKTYGVKIADAATADEHKEIFYSANIQEGMIIKSLEEVYYYADSAVYKNTLVKTDTVNESTVKAKVCINDTVSSLISVDDDYIYCFADGYITAIERTEDGSGKAIRVSERTVNSGWYKPETVTLTVNDGEKTYMLYCDNSATGNYYIYYSDLSDLAAPQEETDDDGEVEYYYLTSSFIGKMPAADRAKIAEADISAINSELVLETDGEDNVYDASVNKARAAYDALDADAKACVATDKYNKLINAEKAVDLGAAFMKLKAAFADGTIIYDDLDESEKAQIDADYATAKALVKSYGDDYSTIAAYLEDNLKYYYQEVGAQLDV